METTTYNPEVVDSIRKEQDRRTVQEGTAIWRKRQEELLRHKHREQRELRQMQSNYSPWGKPGGGAPCNGSLKRKNVILEPLGLHYTNNDYNDELAASPWSRPGPGGTPWRDPRLLGVRFFESMGWTTKSLINRLRSEKMNPLAVIDSNKFFDETSKPSIHRSAPTSPHKQGNSSYNNQIDMYKLTGGVELGPLLTARQLDSHPTRYHSTDATRPGYLIDSLRNMNVGNREHLAALNEQIRRKREQTLVDKRLEHESCRRHFDTFRKFWGRPGHGAPIDHVYRNDLYDILYRTEIFHRSRFGMEGNGTAYSCGSKTIPKRVEKGDQVPVGKMSCDQITNPFQQKPLAAHNNRMARSTN